MAEKDVLKEKGSDSWKVQYTRNKGGVMINVRGDVVDDVYKDYLRATELLDEEVTEEKTFDPDLPFYGDGKNVITPYKKKDGTVGYEVEHDGEPQECPVCGGKVFERVQGQWGDFYKCQKDSQIIRIKKKKEATK